MLRLHLMLMLQLPRLPPLLLVLPQSTRAATRHTTACGRRQLMKCLILLLLLLQALQQAALQCSSSQTGPACRLSQRQQHPLLCWSPAGTSSTSGCGQHSQRSWAMAHLQLVLQLQALLFPRR